MRSGFLAYSIVFILFIAGCGSEPAKPVAVSADSAVPPPPPPRPSLKQGLVYPVELVKGQRNAYENAIGHWGDSLIVATYKGKVSYVPSEGAQGVLLFDIKAEFMVDKLYVAPYGKGQWFVVWLETDHIGVKTNLALFDQGADKPKWERSFPAINPGRPVIDGDFAYVTMLGMAGKVAVPDGTIAWKHDSLFTATGQRFKEFETPKVFPDKVVFIDLPVKGLRLLRDTIIADPETGKSLR